MRLDQSAFSSASVSSQPPTGCWHLASHQALTLLPTESGILRIAQGRVWLTGLPQPVAPANDSGDRFLGAGEQVMISAGHRLVIESWPQADGAAAYFSWQADPAPALAPSSWQALVAQPLRDLRQATGQMATVSGLLLLGLLRYSVAYWRGSPRAAACTQS